MVSAICELEFTSLYGRRSASQAGYLRAQTAVVLEHDKMFTWYLKVLQLGDKLTSSGTQE